MFFHQDNEKGFFAVLTLRLPASVKVYLFVPLEIDYVALMNSL
jgi:hypothetical protein